MTPSPAAAAGLILLSMLPLVFSCRTAPPPAARRAVRPGEAAAALAAAESKAGAPYLWGGDGPEAFDCSGLIVWAYQQALGRRALFFDGLYPVDDLTMDMFYRTNIIRLEPEEVKPGDIVFITSSRERITHGGLVVALEEGARLRFLNASSFSGGVVYDEWGLQQFVRGQWIAGFGRLKVNQE